jgi:hypothetical protein
MSIMIDPNELLTKIEKQRLWAFFHKDWLLQIRELLRPQLPRQYAVFVESEAILVSPFADQASTSVLPDLSVARPEKPSIRETDRKATTQATVEVEESCELYTTHTLLIRRAPENHLVAVCEVLSPTNKGVFGELHQRKYLEKRDGYLDAGVNVLEIDALLEGKKLVPPPLASLSDFERHAWTVLHGKGNRRWRGWGWSPRDELPRIAWSVEEGMQVEVDLLVALRQAAEFNPWENLIGQ